MQRSTRSATKRAAEASAAGAEPTAQRQRREEEETSAAVHGAPPQRTTLSPAQRCAADTLAAVFSFLPFRHLPAAIRVCRVWLAAVAKVQSKGTTLHRVSQLTCACASDSALRRQVTELSFSARSHGSQPDLQLAVMRPLATALPRLRSMKITPRAENIQTLLAQKSREQALADLRAAFPPQLRELHLHLTDDHATAVCQLLIDALPAMKELERLSLSLAASTHLEQSAPLSLEPLLQLPRLTHLTCDIGDLTVSQLLTIKQISTLQHFNPGWRGWTAAQLAALCRPPHRLQQLQQVNLRGTFVDEAAMAELVHLPALTAIDPPAFTPSAFVLLPRFPRLRRLVMNLERGFVTEQESDTALISALLACPVLTDLTVQWETCSKPFGSRLMQAVPRLRTLSFQNCSLPALRVLRHVPKLKALSLIKCPDMRAGHVVGLGAFVPRLESLTLEECDSPLLDKDERQLLTPPGALGLPRLREFNYRRSSDSDGFDASDEEVESD